jgi:hypothetical protein
MAIAEVARDTEYLITGKQEGSGVVISGANKDFRSCGAIPGLAVKNDTAGTNGHVVSATENTVTTDISFAQGDTYRIFATDTYNSIKDVVYLDKRYGHKATNKHELVDGLFPEDRDYDEDRRKVFAPGQPDHTGG